MKKRLIYNKFSPHNQLNAMSDLRLNFGIRKFVFFSVLSMGIAHGSMSLAQETLLPPVDMTTKESRTPIPLELPLLDLPVYTESAYPFPTMPQSLALSNDFYLMAHYGLENISEKKWVGRLAIATFDVASFVLPLSYSWLHEEWHRAVFSHRNISSHNGVYDFRISDSIPVDRLRDEDLAQLKKDHPAEFVRMSSAGMESQIQQNFAFERVSF